ncbi:MAG: hypothetical protein ABR579_09970 [Actinomycetota bacterium]
MRYDEPTVIGFGNAEVDGSNSFTSTTFWLVMPVGVLVAKVYVMGLA